MSVRPLQQTDFPQSSPAPTPSRANYGFALYLASHTAFALYCAWALNLSNDGNKPWLHSFGLTYLPQVYWAVAIPVHLLTTVAWVGLILYPSLNMLTNNSIDDPSVIKDSYTVRPNEIQSPTSVPQLYDLNPADVTKILFMDTE